MDGNDTKRFIDSNGGLGFEGLHFRHGATFTCPFGLTERYRIEDDRLQWGWPGLHDGVDRTGGENGETRDVIVSPFDFARSGYRDWHGRLWGSDVYLYHTIGFRLRISHAYPDEIEIMDRLTAGYPVEKGELIGRAGSYGMSTGRHTHVEVESWGFDGGWLMECEALEHILRKKHGRRADTEYTDEELWELYDGCEKTQTIPGPALAEDYRKLLSSRKDGRDVVFLNAFKMRLRDAKNRITTLYSSERLFGM